MLAATAVGCGMSLPMSARVSPRQRLWPSALPTATVSISSRKRKGLPWTNLCNRRQPFQGCLYPGTEGKREAFLPAVNLRCCPAIKALSQSPCRLPGTQAARNESFSQVPHSRVPILTTQVGNTSPNPQPVHPIPIMPSAFRNSPPLFIQARHADIFPC